MEKGKFVPAEVRVKDERRLPLRSPSKERWGFELRVVSELPILEFAKNDLLQTLGDPGPFPSDESGK